MHYRVEVLDSNRTRIAYLTGLVSAHLSERMNGRGILTAETVDSDDWPPLKTGMSFLRVRDSDGSVLGTYRIIETERTRILERRSLRMTARHIIADTTSEMFADAVNCVNYSPAELMTLVLGYSEFTAGIVEPDMTVPFVRFEYESVHTCLLRICSLTGGELSLDETTGALSLVNCLGESNGASIRYGVNLCGASRTVRTSRMANRIWGVGGGEPPLLLDAAPTGNGSGYVEDTDSIEAWGLVEDVYQEPTLEHVINLVATPALDGIYTNGLCENWIATGSPLLTAATESGTFLQGLAAQRIQSDTDGEGIAQTVTVTPGTVYSLMANLFITDGTVRVRIVDGDTVYRREAPVTGTGFVAVKIENWKPNTGTVTVEIVQEGAGSADFVVDSVQIAAGAHTMPFTVGNSADVLYDHTCAHLNIRKEPSVTYTVDCIGLPDEYSATGSSAFGLGDTITVIDPALDLNVSTRVMERNIDLLNPRRTSIRLDNTTRSLAEVFATLREEQEKGIRLQRAAFAESSNAAEEGSVRLGFANNAFRFYGRVTPSEWDRVDWTAGILRVGIGYYSISASSLIGLPANTTRYIYFDRTTPDNFGMTADIDQAEGTDRILIFAVTTTTSPDLCVIHPMGVIHD